MSRLLSIAGTPSPKLYAVLNVVRTLAQVTIGEPVIVVANSLEALRKELPDRSKLNDRPVVFLSDYPQPDVLTTFYDLKAPVAICIDDFVTVALFNVVSRGFSGVDAARFATMGLVNLEPTVVAPPPLAFFVGDPKAETLAGLVCKLAAFYRLPVNDDLVEKVLQYLGFAKDTDATLGEYAARKIAAPDKTARDGRASLEERSPLDSELIDFLAPQYDAVAHGRPLERLEWPVYALLRPEFPDWMTIGPIDLTGPARYFYFGPYFALPAGAWTADILLEVQDCYSDNEIAVDVCAAKVLSMVRAKLPPRGVYGCQIQFEIEDPSKPVEIRMQLLTGAIEGVIQLRKIVLHRLASLDDEGEAAAA
jgi:hypothetical protein